MLMHPSLSILKPSTTKSACKYDHTIFVTHLTLNQFGALAARISIRDLESKHNAHAVSIAFAHLFFRNEFLGWRAVGDAAVASAIWVRVIAKYNAGVCDEGERERGGVH